VFIIYLVKFSFLFFSFATDCVFSVNKDYHNSDKRNFMKCLVLKASKVTYRDGLLIKKVLSNFTQII